MLEWVEFYHLKTWPRGGTRKQRVSLTLSVISQALAEQQQRVQQQAGPPQQQQAAGQPQAQQAQVQPQPQAQTQVVQQPQAVVQTAVTTVANNAVLVRWENSFQVTKQYRSGVSSGSWPTNRSHLCMCIEFVRVKLYKGGSSLPIVAHNLISLKRGNEGRDGEEDAVSCRPAGANLWAGPSACRNPGEGFFIRSSPAVRRCRPISSICQAGW